MAEVPILLRALTPFEHLVLQSVCEGKSNAVIANQTGHSEKVVENTVSRSARAFALTAGPDINLRVVLALAYRTHFGDAAFDAFSVECQYLEHDEQGRRVCTRHIDH